MPLLQGNVCKSLDLYASNAIIILSFDDNIIIFTRHVLLLNTLVYTININVQIYNT